MLEGNSFAANKKEKNIVNKLARKNLLKYLSTSKKLIRNSSLDKDKQNQLEIKCNELLEEFRYWDGEVYYADKHDFIESIKAGKWFRTGAEYTYANKIQYFDGMIYSFFIGYSENELFAGIERIAINELIVDNELSIEYKLDETDEILFGEDPEDCAYKQAPVYNKKDKIDKEKFINYILNLDMLKGKEFISKEEYYAVLDKLNQNNINDLPKLSIWQGP